LILGLAVMAVAQKPDDPAFEVASVKQSAPPQPNAQFVFFGPARGGPGTRDPEQITWANATLRNLLMTAFDLQSYQIVGPDWISTERYDIAAKVAPGASKQQVPLMWQTLLKERFGLVLHREAKEFVVDELTVARNGPKLKTSDLPADADAFTPGEARMKMDKTGLPEMNGYGLINSLTATPSGVSALMLVRGLSMREFAFRLGQQLGHPILDKTGLTGRYDFTVEFTPDLRGLPPLPPQPGAAGPSPAAPAAEAPSDPGSSLPSAIEKQLGLKLVRGKGKLDVVVVDHIEKTPTDN
jgi:uncharacterized protein (TIGR03435 family)